MARRTANGEEAPELTVTTSAGSLGKNFFPHFPSSFTLHPFSSLVPISCHRGPSTIGKVESNRGLSSLADREFSTATNLDLRFLEVLIFSTIRHGVECLIYPYTYINIGSVWMAKTEEATREKGEENNGRRVPGKAPLDKT